MKRFLVAAALALTATAAYATCTTHTFMQGGRMVICTTCCSFGHCTTNCI
jgi:hypothetical protein